MGVGDSALLGTLRACGATGAQEVTAGLLSLKYMEAMDEQDIKLPMLTWRKPAGSAAWALCVPEGGTQEEVQESRALLELFTPYRRVEDLLAAVLAHVAAVGGEGTAVEIFHLHADELVFDPRAPNGDITLRPGCKTHTNAASPAEGALPLDASLRAYCEVLYVAHPHKAPMVIELCGARVAPRSLLAELHKPLTYTYDPDNNAALAVRMTFGLDLADKAGAGAEEEALPRLSAHHGIAVYFRSRLILARLKVGRAARGGVLGVCLLAHCTPAPTKQAFLDTTPMRTLKARLSANQDAFVLSCITGEHTGGLKLIAMDEVVAALRAAVAADVAQLEAGAAFIDAVNSDGRPVVCCEACGKYRFISPALYEQLSASEERWVCADNQEDAGRASCEAPQEPPRPDDGRERGRAPEEAVAQRPAWLPARWRAVHVTTRDGRVDKYFYPPSSTQRLRSKLCVAAAPHDACMPRLAALR
jgi:hypothetical protein